MSDRLTAPEVIRVLELKPHPEGGHYRETFRDPREVDGRSVGTAIYYLLTVGERSHWHHVDAAELWHFYDGAPLELEIADAAGRRCVLLGPDLKTGQRPQAVVPTGAWQAARTLGAWTLVGCTVAPGFDFAGFEMAPAGWSPKGS
ncbi:MAG: cupin domain-containing protein [Brevundimonas sp.]|nr:MAG: cupin domain-containing protein [Brevundimonas sp.]